MKPVEVLRISHFDPAESGTEFYVNTLAVHLRTSHTHMEKPHRHDFYAFIVFTAGSGMHHIDFKTYEVRPGSVFLMSPGQMHHWELSPETDGWIFFHSRGFYENRFLDEKLSDYPFFSPIQSVDHFELSIPDSRYLSQKCRELFLCKLTDPVLRRHFLLSTMALVYVKVAATLKMDEQPGTSLAYLSLFRRFSHLLETSFVRHKSPEYYAGQLHVSAKHLNRVNRAIVGKTTSGVILDRVVLEAGRLLLHSGDSLSEIAAALGYDDYAYFSKLFKNRTGYTAGHFRKKG